MKQIILLMLILFTVGMLFATRATGYATSASVTINTLMPPTSLIAEDMGGMVQLNWSVPTLGTPTSYNIYRSETPDNLASFTLLASTIDSYYDDYDFFSGGYYVTSVYPQGESRRSNIASVGRLQPVLVRLSLDNSTNSALISWDRVRDADSYLLYYCDNPYADFPAQWSRPINIDDNRFVDPLSELRFYRVMASIPARINPEILQSNSNKQK
jgi:hypothetical protein